MKFLMTMRSKPGLPPEPPEQALARVQAAKAYLEERLADGRLECAYGFVGGDGFCVANRASAEEVMADLMTFPQYPFMDWEILPLVDAVQSYDMFIAAYKKQVG